MTRRLLARIRVWADQPGNAEHMSYLNVLANTGDPTLAALLVQQTGHHNQKDD